MIETIKGRQTSFLNATWLPVRDGNDTGRAIFDGHYSRRHYRDGRDPKIYVGPGEKLVLITPDAGALFIWRKFIDGAIPQQVGINCAVFRREYGAVIASELIRAAEELAWERWPGQRLYTYVDSSKIRHKRDPGRCFRKAGWKQEGTTKTGKLIFAKYTE